MYSLSTKSLININYQYSLERVSNENDLKQYDLVKTENISKIEVEKRNYYSVTLFRINL